MTQRVSRNRILPVRAATRAPREPVGPGLMSASAAGHRGSTLSSAQLSFCTRGVARCYPPLVPSRYPMTLPPLEQLDSKRFTVSEKELYSGRQREDSMTSSLDSRDTYSQGQKMTKRGFPGGAVVKNPPASAGGMGSSPGLGRSHMPWSN